jgi:two-component system, OmpR family, phosphate regulon response regulator PhoB
MLVRKRLERRGYTVISAVDGAEALALATEHLPDAAVLDGLMPGLNGDEVCARLRADERTAAMPVIVLTAKAGDASRDAAFHSGVDAYMLKPFSMEALDACLQQLIAARG